MVALLVRPEVHTAFVAVENVTANPDEALALTVTGDCANVLLLNETTTLRPSTYHCAERVQELARRTLAIFSVNIFSVNKA